MGRRRLSEKFLTEDQIRRREINDRYNKKRKESMSVDNVVSLNKDVTILNVRAKPNDVTKQTVNEFIGGKSWHDLEIYFTSPTAILQISLATILTSYCTYQSIMYFSMSDFDKVSAYSTAIAAEFILISTEILFAMSKSRGSRALSALFLAITMFCVGSLMHGSITGNEYKRSSDMSIKIEEKESLILLQKTIEENLKTIPVDQVSKRNKQIDKLTLINSQVSDINSEITLSKTNVSGVSLYSWWIRIAAMILNAVIINSLFRKSPL